MTWETYTRNNMTKYMTIEELNNAHPSGEYSPEFGCYFFVDYDGELGYFIQYSNEKFEAEPNWADLDTLADDERLELEAIMNRILLTQ